MKYGSVSLGQLEDAINKLGGEEGLNLLLSGRAELRLINPPSFTVWTTVEVGTGAGSIQSSSDLESSLGFRGVHLGSGWSKAALLKCPLEVTRRSLSLVNISVEEMEFPNGGYLQEIYTRAVLFGLHLCPPEVGPRLCLLDPALLAGLGLEEQNEVFIAIKPINPGGDHDRPGIFVVGSNPVDGAYLSCSTEDKGSHWVPPERRMIFCKG